MTLKLQQRKVFGIDLDNYRIDRRIEEKLVGSKSEEEVLVFGSSDGVYYFDGRIVKKIAERNGPVMALEVWNRDLYDAGYYRDAGYYHEIYRTIDNEVVAERDDWIRALKVWNGELYDAGDYRKIYRTMDNEVVAERNNRVLTLEVLGGDLYDAGYYRKIYRTRDSKVVLDFGRPIFCMLAVPRSVLSGLI